MKMDYRKNIQLALALGFKEIIDENAFNGKYYIKNDKIWIHNIEALKLKLKISNNEELKTLGYDIDSYYKYLDFTDSMVDIEIFRIKSIFKENESLLSGQLETLEDHDILGCMAILYNEGYDEDVLADFAHQISKGK